jgi:hypothetical protein
MSMPAFHTTTNAVPPTTRVAISAQYTPARPVSHPPTPAANRAATATAIARRESVRSSTAPAGRLATTAVPNMIPTTSPASVEPIPSESRISGVTLAGTIS